MPRSQRVGFSITGEFITEHCRTLMTEGKVGRAWLLLQDGLPELSITQIAEIMSGRKKLVGTNEVELVDDDVKVDAHAFMKTMMETLDRANKVNELVEPFRLWGGLCHHTYYPPKKNGRNCVGTPVGLITPMKLQDMLASDFTSLLMELFPKLTDEQWEKFWNDPDVIERFDYSGAGLLRPMPPKGVETDDEGENDLMDPAKRSERVAKTLENMGINAQKAFDDVDTYIARQQELDTRPCPKPDRTFKSDNGWILPDGKFYPCQNTMEHIWLAEKINGFTEKQAEEAGWIKVAFSPMFGDFHMLSFKKPTQKQINTGFDWSQKNEKRAEKYQEWLKGWEDDK